MNVISYVPKILIIVVMMVVLFGFVIPVLSTSFALDWTDPENADENLELITGKVVDTALPFEKNGAWGNIAIFLVAVTLVVYFCFLVGNPNRKI